MNSSNIELFRKIIEPTNNESIEKPKAFDKFNKNNILYQQKKQKVKLVNKYVSQEKKIILGAVNLNKEKQLREKELRERELMEKTIQQKKIPEHPINKPDNFLNRKPQKEKFIYNSNICSKNLKNCIIEYDLPTIKDQKILEIKIYSNLDHNINIKVSVDNNIIPKSNILWNRNWVTINYIDDEIYKEPNKLYIESDDVINIKGIYCTLVDKNNLVTDNINLSCNLINKATVYKKQKVPNFVIGVISDNFTFENMNYIFNSVYINADMDLNNLQFDLLLCESAWGGVDESWRDQLFMFNTNGNSRNKILKIIDFCKKKKIPTVFYAKEDPIFFDGFKNCSVLFDLVITTSIECVSKYKQLGCKNVISTTFLINPIIHNPIKSNLINKIAFPGSYYNFLNNRCQVMNIILNNMCNYPLDIFDRKYLHNKATYQIKKLQVNKAKCEFPNNYSPYIKPSLTYSQVIDNVYKKYKCVLNINTISDSQSMFSRRVMELAGCGTNIISNESLGMKNIFGNNIYYLNEKNNYKLDLNINNLPNINIKLYETVHSNYTYKHLFKKIFNHFNLKISLEPKICILTSYDIKISDNIKTAYTVFYDENFIPTNTFDWILCLNKKDYYYDNTFIKKIILPIEYVDENITISHDDICFKFNCNNIDKNTFLLNIKKINDYNLLLNNLTSNFTINNIYNPLRNNSFEYSKYLPVKLNELLIKDKTKLIPVVLCVWNRIDKLNDLISNLNLQKYQNFHLYIWNNNFKNKDTVDSIISNKNQKFNISWHHSSENIGGFGRFILAKFILKHNDFPQIIFIDDDQLFNDDVFYELVKRKKINTSLHWSGRKFKKNLNYWDSWSNIFSDKKESYNFLDYGGTGTVITDSKIFKDEAFFYLNKKYLFIEDLWFSYYVSKFYNYQLINCSFLGVKNINDGKDQSIKKEIKDLKNEFLKVLREHGNWNV